MNEREARRYNLQNGKVDANPLYTEIDRLKAVNGKLLEACKCVDRFFQDNMKAMPITCRGVAEVIGAAIEAAEGRG